MVCEKAKEAFFKGPAWQGETEGKQEVALILPFLANGIKKKGIRRVVSNWWSLSPLIPNLDSSLNVRNTWKQEVEMRN